LSPVRTAQPSLEFGHFDDAGQDERTTDDRCLSSVDNFDSLKKLLLFSMREIANLYIAREARRSRPTRLYLGVLQLIERQRPHTQAES
jgi:hypothetical protein